MSLPTVTVITPTAGKRPFLRAAVESIQAQTGVAVRHVVVADGPEAAKNCRALLGEDPACELVAAPTKRGASAARNVGLKLAASDYIFFLDDDDLVHPRMLAACIQACEAAQATMGVCGTVSVDGEAQHVTHLHFGPPAEGQLVRFLRHDVGWIPCGCIYRRDCPGLAEGWPETVPNNEDFHMNAKCLVEGARAGVAPEILSFWRHHQMARLSTSPLAMDAKSGFDILEDLRDRLVSKPIFNEEAQAALALGYLKFMPELGRSGQLDHCRQARGRAAELFPNLTASERVRLVLYQWACAARPSMSWRILAKSRLSPHHGLYSRDLTPATREEGAARLAETLEAIKIPLPTSA